MVSVKSIKMGMKCTLVRIIEEYAWKKSWTQSTFLWIFRSQIVLTDNYFFQPVSVSLSEMRIKYNFGNAFSYQHVKSIFVIANICLFVNGTNLVMHLSVSWLNIFEFQVCQKHRKRIFAARFQYLTLFACTNWDIERLRISTFVVSCIRWWVSTSDKSWLSEKILKKK